MNFHLPNRSIKMEAMIKIGAKKMTRITEKCSKARVKEKCQRTSRTLGKSRERGMAVR